ncbi:MAG TPA: right-handed parallel beta-helix repeat-containing protein [Mucilaginibacter sp.]|jgi:hypothetical protein|nr:right-handed parallel beta-helix repeat-containing protein [Mucilaginibacter sp.]
MNLKKYFFAFLILPAALFLCAHTPGYSKSYYVNLNGRDNNPGTMVSPFKTIRKINSIHLNAGDAIYFKSGQVFSGTIKLGNIAGSKAKQIVLSSYGAGKAIINGDSVTAISLYKAKFVTIRNLKLTGLGRKTGNRQSGLAIINSNDINATDLDISGFQKAGLLIDSSSYITANNIFAHDNGSAGITVEGRNSKKDSRNIHIINCRAENNPGDPTKLDNHSGNGIVVGHCTNVVIDLCTATNNGWDMPRIGNGPVGIWCYEADSVLIQHCLSYRNKTSKGGADGGGFDLDGGTTNSIIQYCFSYENQGSGYCIFQYWGASPFYNNIIRYNITENDGTVSDSQAGMYVWNSSGDANQFYNTKVYGNIVYNSKVAALSFSEKSMNKGFDFHNNIFVGMDSLIIGKDILGKCTFTANNWWSLKSGFNINGIKSLKAWAEKTGKEQKDGKIAGLNENPRFKNPGTANLTSASQIASFTGYKLPEGSKLRKLLK